MATTLATVRLMNPEFENVSDGIIQAYLDEALLEIDLEVWGALADQGQRYLALHKMALSPQGLGAKLVGSKGETTYNMHFEALAKTVSMGFRVAWPLP